MRSTLLATVTVATALLLAVETPRPVTAASAGDRPDGSTAVRAIDLTARPPAPCPALSTIAHPLIGGGCVVRAVPGRAAMDVLTMFGPLDFARCDLGFNLQIGPTGDAWLQGLTATGGQACSDVLPCRSRTDDMSLAEKLPWKGSISRGADRRLQAAFDMCLDTCMGRFEGPLELELTERRGDWRMRATDAVAGTSGFRVDGEWELDVADTGESARAYARREGAAAAGFDLR